MTLRPPDGMFAIVVHGLRARFLLSAGSLLLTTLAVASALLGPAFSLAVTNSYVVTRVSQAPNQLTGLSWEFRPGQQYAGRLDAAMRRADQIITDRKPPGYLSSTLQAESTRIRVSGDVGEVTLLAKPGACEHLVVSGRCPTTGGEAIMLAGDADEDGVQVGDLVSYGEPIGDLRVVGTYVVPDAESAAGISDQSADYWFDLHRLASRPWFYNSATNALEPRRPAPYLVAAGTFDRLPPDRWLVRVDSRLAVSADWTPADLDALAQRARAQSLEPEQLDDGALSEVSLNDLTAISTDVAQERRTAAAAIAPAVFSLVLVALALLLRLLLAAGELRVPELALGSLRGLSSRSIWALGLAEPLVLLVVAAPLGVLVGAGISAVLIDKWLVPGLPLAVPWQSWLGASFVVVAASAVSVLAAGTVLRRSLSSQLAGVTRPGRTKRTTLVAGLLLVALAAVVTMAKVSDSGSRTLDATDLVLPVLLAVVAGLAATRGTAAFARWRAQRHRSRSIAAFVAIRAISRRHEGTLVILPLTAAIAVCVFGAGIYGVAASWRTSVAATEAPAATVWNGDLPMTKAVELTHGLDPDGEWLMAAGVVTALDTDYVVVDSPRLPRVAIWPDQWTPNLSVQEVADQLAPGPVPQVTGHRLALTVNSPTGGGGLVVQLRLRPSGARAHEMYLGPYAAGTSIRSVEIPCRKVCALEGMVLGGPAGSPTDLHGQYLVGPLSVDGVDNLDALAEGGWVDAPIDTGVQSLRNLELRGGQLVLEIETGAVPGLAFLATGDLPKQRPVLVGGMNLGELGHKPPGAASSPIGGPPPVSAFATSESLPLLGPRGVLIDYTMMSSNRTFNDQNIRVSVLANENTPAEISTALAGRGFHVETTFDEQRHSLDKTAYALALRLYAVAAVLVLIMAIAGLTISTAVQLPARRMDAAALRVVGVSRRAVMSATTRELVAVLGAAAVAGLAAGSLAEYLVLRTITLGHVETVTSPRVVAAIDTTQLLVLALAAATTLGAAALISAFMTVRGARGSTLRERSR